RLLLIPSDASSSPWTPFETEIPGTLVWATVYQPHQEQDSHARLGIPNDEVIYSFSVFNPLGWENYFFFLYGTYAPTTRNAETAPLFSIRMKTTPDQAAEELQLVAWLRVVFYVEQPEPTPDEAALIQRILQLYVQEGPSPVLESQPEPTPVLKSHTYLWIE